MEPLPENALQVLRVMDKHDKLGTQGVVTELQKPQADFGAGLDPARARMIGAFLDTKGADNSETLANMREWFLRAAAKQQAAKLMMESPLVVSRCQMMCVLDDDVLAPDGQTGLDYFLSLPVNTNETWDDGGRPNNIGWMLDDLLGEARKAGVEASGLAYFLSGLIAARETKETN